MAGRIPSLWHRMIPSTLALGTSPRLAGLDGWRGIMAALIAGGHFTERLVVDVPGFWLRIPAGLAPTLFFLLSGFLLTRSMLREHDATGDIDVSRFYGRRLLRFAPAYFAFVLFKWAFYTVRGFPWPWEKVVLALLVAPNWYSVIWDEQSINVTYHLWSLAVGVQFFLVWPLVLRPLLRRVRPMQLVPWMLVLALLIGATRSILSLQGAASWLYLYNAPHMRADALLIGCALAIMAAERTRRATPALFEGPVFAWGALLLVALSGALGSLSYLRSIGHSVNALFGAVLLWNVVHASSPRLVALLEAAPVRLLGVVGFSLVLWHNMAINFFPRLPMLPVPARIAAILVLMAVLTLASFVMLERPALRRLGQRPS